MVLVEMYRHLRDKPQWYHSGSSHGPIPVRYYVNPPRNLEVYAFVDSLWGTNFFATEPNFRRLAAAVRKLTWAHDDRGVPDPFIQVRRSPR